MQRMADLAFGASLRSLAAILNRASRRSSLELGAVLLYHDVAETTGDPRRSIVPPLGIGALREQLLFLRERYEVVPISELRRRVSSRKKGQRIPVALTFDDDVESQSTLVAPLLRELDLPATFFLTGSSLDGPSAFWWHDLSELYARGGEPWQEVCREAQRRWGPLGKEFDPHTLARTIENLRPAARDSFAERLREIAASPPTDPGLSEVAVVQLAEAGFDIGFHTKRHYLVQTLDDEELHRALRDGADRLRGLVGRPLKAIAYPHCRPGDFRIAAAAADAGFELGFLCNDRAIGGKSHPLLLERITGWQPSIARFAWKLGRPISKGP